MAGTVKYDIFISWSKDDNDVGRRIANRLKEFISDVFSSFVDAFVSDVDITDKWFEELSDVLKGVKYGVMILTPKALDSAWVNYELGVLRGGDKIIKTFRFSDRIDRTKTPFAIRQDKQFDKETLLEFLTKVYEDKNPGSNKKGFNRSFEREWDSFYRDIQSYTAELDETYERNYLIRNQYDKKISEQKVDIERLQKDLAAKEVEIQKLKTEMENYVDSDKTQLINALNEKIEKLNEDLAKKDEEILAARQRTEEDKNYNRIHTFINVGFRNFWNNYKKIIYLALAAILTAILTLSFMASVHERHKQSMIAIIGIPIVTTLCFITCKLWINKTSSQRLKTFLIVSMCLGLLMAGLVEFAVIVDGFK